MNEINTLTNIEEKKATNIINVVGKILPKVE